MSEGELYRRLIVMPRSDSPEYFMLVRRVIREMKADSPDFNDYGAARWDDYDWEMGKWFVKWLGD